jgi:hypothetical protein
VIISQTLKGQLLQSNIERTIIAILQSNIENAIINLNGKFTMGKLKSSFL